MIIHGYIPDILMDTILTPILKDKKGNVSDTDNYRPIALTCIISKVLELLLLERYRNLFLTSHNQFGFKDKLGTDMCVFTLKQVLDYYHSLSSPVYVAFMDASKAFDKVNHFHLLSKLIERDIPIIIVRLLYYWFRSQRFMVRWGNCVSQSFNVQNGVRQGGIGSPIFFNVYLDSLSTILNNSCTGCMINNCLVNHLFYADDSILLAPSPRALQRLLDICDNYAREFELTFNVKKTKIMCFKPKNLSKMCVPTFTLDGKDIDYVDKQKYLGVVLEEKLCDNNDMNRQMKSIYGRGNMLIKKFSICSTDVKAKLFKSYCNSLYCGSLWSNFNQLSFNKLQTSYNNVFRHLFKLDRKCSISAKCVEFDVDCFKVLLRKLTYSLRCRILSSENVLIQSIVKSCFFLCSSLTNRWNNILFSFKG